jgi:hypothetical protein
MKHAPTPGPWRKTGNIIWGAEIQKKVCHILALPRAVGESTAKEESANASLIAASPDLLEALSQVKAALDKGQLIGDPAYFRDRLADFVKLVNLITIAVHKATGGAE